MTINAWWLLVVAWAAMGLAGWVRQVLLWVEDREPGNLRVGEFIGFPLVLLGCVIAGPLSMLFPDNGKNGLRKARDSYKWDADDYRQKWNRAKDERGKAEKELDALTAAYPAMKREGAAYCPTCGKPARV